MPWYLQHKDKLLTLEMQQRGETVTLQVEDGPALTAELVHADDGSLTLRLPLPEGGFRTLRATVSGNGKERWVTIAGQTWVFTPSAGRPRRGAGSEQSAGVLRAPMPGQVRAVQAAEGDVVAKGQTILVLEAMKMEIRIQAPFDGTLASLKVTAGQTVEREEVLGEVVKNEK